MADLEIRVTSKNAASAGIDDVSRRVKSLKTDFQAVESASKIDSKINVDDSELAAADRRIAQIDAETIDVPVNVDLSGADEAVDGLESKFGDVDLSDLSGSMQSQLGGMLAAGGPIAGVVGPFALTLGGDFIEGFTSGLSSKRSKIELAIRTGFDNVELADVGASAGDAFTAGFGESLGDLSNITATLKQELGGIDDSLDLTEATKQASVLTDIIGTDLVTSVNVAKRMIVGGLVPDTETAFDLMTTSAQKFGINADEILDVMNEFTPVFSQLGIDGERAFGTIGTLVQEGLLPNVDRAAELFQEFNIRLNETGALREPLARLNVDIERMQQLLAQGRGDEALSEITRALLEMKDPAERNAVAVEIFGAALEDAADKGRVLEVILDDGAAAMDGFEGSADRAASAAEASATEWDKLSRSVTDFGKVAGEETAGQVNILIDVLKEGVAGSLYDVINGTDDAKDSFDGLSEKARDAALGSFPSLDDAISGTVGHLGEAADQMGDTEGATEDLTLKIDQLNDAMSRFADRFRSDDIFRSIESDIDRAVEATAELEAGNYTLAEGFDTSSEAGRRAEEAVQSLSGNLDDLGTAYLDGTVSAEEFQAGHDSIRAGLLVVADQLNLNKAETQALIDKYGEVPPEVSTKVEAETASASARMDALRAQLSNLDGMTANTYTYHRVTYVGVGGPGFKAARAHGGVVGAAAPGGVREGWTTVGEEGEELVKLAPGSQVFSTPDTNRMRATGTGGFNGTGGAGVTVNINVAGSIWSERELAGMIRDELLQGSL